MQISKSDNSVIIFNETKITQISAIKKKQNWLCLKKQNDKKNLYRTI